MKYILLNRALPGLTALIGFVFFLSFSQSSHADLECRLLYHIGQGYLNQHIYFDTENKNLEQRTVDQMIKKLDISKIYLLQSDVDQIKTSLNGIFAKLKGSKAESPNCQPLLKIQDV